MREYPCKACNILTTWSPSYCQDCDPNYRSMFATKYKEDVLREAMDEKLRRLKAKKGMIKGSRDDYWYPDPYMVDEEYHYVKDIQEKEYYRYKEKERYISPEEEKRLKREAEERQAEYERNLKLQTRVQNSDWKDCAECESFMPHDEMDYLCIKCREGEEALPKNYAAYAPSRPTPEPDPF